MYKPVFFKPHETACKCCGKNEMSPDLMQRLDIARKLANIPFKINSGFRCQEHNKRVGGSANSSHIRGLAVDIACTDDRTRFILIEALLEAGFSRLGIHERFIHVDVDNKKNSAIWFY